MKLIAGLGNTGGEYAGTRHNAGFDFLDYIAGRARLKFDKKNKLAVYCGKNIKGVETMFIKPLTYMNLSGRAVGFFTEKHKIRQEDILVVHDDIDIPLYKVKIKKGGGDAGHKGVRSIIDALGGGGFARLRVGVGRPESKGGACDYVLGEMNGEEKEEFIKAFKSMENFTMNFIHLGYEKAAGRFRG